MAEDRLRGNGTRRPPSAEMTVKSVKLTIADDDVGPGRVVLRLVADATADPLVDESSIDESGDDNSTNLIAQVVGGTPYSQEVQVAVTIGDGATLASNTLTIAADARTSDAIVVTAATDDNDADEVVIITGTATLPDGGDDDTDRDPVSSANQPGDIILVVEDDDEDPSAPRNLDVDVTATAGDPRVLTINATWDAPSNLGKADGTDRTSVTYQYRFERSSVIDDAAWAIATSPQTIDLTTIAGVDLTNVWERDFTVELRVTLGTGATDPGVPGTTVTKEFRTPADPGDGS